MVIPAGSESLGYVAGSNITCAPAKTADNENNKTNSSFGFIIVLIKLVNEMRIRHLY
jgi:hypothetical protein